MNAAKLVLWLGGLAALLGGALSAVAGVPPVAGALVLVAAMAAVVVGAALGGKAPAPVADEDDDDARFRRELRRHAAGGALLAVVFLLLLVGVLAAFAGAGAFLVLGSAASTFTRFYGLVLGALVLGLAAAANAGLASPERTAPGKAAVRAAWAGVVFAALFGVVGLAVALGLLPVNADRAPFVLTAAAAGVFLAARAHAGLPDARAILDWLEHEERLREAGGPRRLVLAFGGTALVLAMASAAAGIALDVEWPSIVATGLAMIGVLLATFSLGVTRVLESLEEGLEDAHSRRHRRKVTLNTLSVVLTLVAFALTVATVLAALAQGAGVALFASFLEFFVEQHPIILAAALLPLLATCWLRLDVASNVAYTDRAKAATIVSAGLTVVLAFFGTFVGSGLAQGSGIAIENAVLMMSGAALSLTIFVHARAQLPGVWSLVREQLKRTEAAEGEAKQSIERQMLTTYVVALVFVVGFVGFFAASSLGVVKVESNVATDTVFFVYLTGGLVLLALVGLRYFQGVRMDPAWRKTSNADIGKRRLTPQELNRYVILGFSGVSALVLVTLGVLVNLGLVSSLGPIPLAPRFATDFYVFAILTGLGPYGWYYNRELKRIRAIDAKFPEFLRDLAESQRSGMTLTEAVITASKGNYGALTPEIRKMAAQIEWGVAFTDALQRFAKRVRTPLVERTVSLIVQAAAAGGNVVDVLTAAADDSREIQQIVKERTNSMAMYVYIIYIAFGVFLTVIGVLNSQFIPEVSKAVAGAKGATVGGITFQPFDEQAFKTLFFHAAIIQGLGGGFVAGVMQAGKPIMGLKHAFILVTIGYVIFRFFIGA